MEKMNRQLAKFRGEVGALHASTVETTKAVERMRDSFGDLQDALTEAFEDVYERFKRMEERLDRAGI
jgi:phage shock protein A